MHGSHVWCTHESCDWHGYINVMGEDVHGTATQKYGTLEWEDCLEAWGALALPQLTGGICSLLTKLRCVNEPKVDLISIALKPTHDQES